ncbi:S41 family peptidase [Filimonas effusa]|uniref:Tricorn protease homolog n=1 Tax=Filimonas effusa TaxID=2508721 RepID=A0A4Q1D648_9BACT|nr:S41 family peptidase [Filimonas effusa]RXK83353.1 PDZ domain-containing protein [Filimonas effusa]
MRKSLPLLALLLSVITATAQTTPKWLRYPAISPDGKTIVFGYKGDLYRVDAGGGAAVPLTLHEAHDMMPVWSRDGKYIAFASDRYGNFDVFVMPATGGTPVRVTYNSAADYPYDFSVDNKYVIYGSGRPAPATSVRFSSPRLFQNLYQVPVTGGRSVLVSAAGMENAHYNSKGTQLVFQDRKGYEDPWRKHHTSSVTRDIWIMDVAGNTYRKISGFEGEDREPLFSADDQYIYYLSEKDGTQNIYKAPVTARIAEQQLTRFKENPVRHLSRSANNTLCFSQDGDIYTLDANGGSAKKVEIVIYNDGRSGVTKNVPVSGGITEFVLSPNGKEIAFITRGELFVTSVEGGQTKRITNTPQQERMVQWNPDGRSLVYAAERGNSWDIYQTSLTRKDEPYFYASTVLQEKLLIHTNGESFQPRYSPDGKEIAYIEDRNLLKVYTLESGKTRTLLPAGHNYSYSDGDWDFQWSPDSKWLLIEDQRGQAFINNTALVRADGSQPSIYPVSSGFGEGGAKWALNGKLMTWISDREGRKSVANQGSREVDVYGVFFDQNQYDRFKLSKDEYSLLQEKEKKEDTAKKGDKKEPLVLDLENLDNRQLRLTINSSSLSDYVLNSDASKLFYLSSFEKGYDLWVTEPRTRETKILAKLGSSGSGIEISKDGKSLFVSNNGGLVKVDAESGKVTPIAINGEMVLNAAEERNYIFEHAWRQSQKKFYDPKLHGVDWKLYHDTYAKFLPHISNNYDFQELLSELLGELNASHTGGRYSASQQGADVTASLGLLYDETYTGEGLKVAEVIAGGPLDKSGVKIAAGDIIEKIDGENVGAAIDWAMLLNRKAGKNTLLSLYRASTKARWEERVKPITIAEENGLLYTRWVRRMTEMTNKLSGGKVGYVHVQGMNDGSFREVMDKVLGRNMDKEALIVDTRFNGGGWLHDDLNTFLSGKVYLQFAPQSNLAKGGEPMRRWHKPSCVLMSEGNYSDAFIFPYIYKQNGIGKLIGMPVPGTGTAVWWETQIDPTLVFGIPMIATIGKENRPTENLQVEPDISVPLTYEAFLAGKDEQLETAVKEMLKTIK